MLTLSSSKCAAGFTRPPGSGSYCSLSPTLAKQLPKRLPGWLHQARALHHLGRTHNAYHLLVDVVELFPDNQTIRYDIAVYAAQRGLLSEAADWLKIVFSTTGMGSIGSGRSMIQR